MMSGFLYSKKEVSIMLSKKYNAAEAEAKWQEFWQEKGIYKFDESSKSPIYSQKQPDTNRLPRMLL